METESVSRIGNGITKGNRKNNRKRRAGRITIVVSFAIAIILFAVIVNEVPIKSTPPQERALIAFTPEVVASFLDVGQYSSLAIDSNTNFPSIVAYVAEDQSYDVWSWNGVSWDVFPGPTPPPSVFIGKYCSIAMNATNDFAVSYYDETATSGALECIFPYANIDTIDSVGNVGQYTSIAINPITNTTAISYYDVTNGNLKVAVNASGLGWTNLSVDQIGNVGQYTNIAFLGANDTLSVLYYDVTNGDLKNAWQWGGTGPWYNVTIHSTGDVGKWPSQAVTPSGDWYGSFYDTTNGNLNYIDWVDGGAGGMGSAVPDSSGDVGQYTSIGVNSTGHVFISYYDVTNGDLKLAWNESTTWYNMTLDSTNDAGRFTSLKIDSDDVIHISYYDATNKDLKYVKVLPTEIPIPEFSEIAIPIVGIIATIAFLSSRRKRE